MAARAPPRRAEGSQRKLEALGGTVKNLPEFDAPKVHGTAGSKQDKSKPPRHDFIVRLRPTPAVADPVRSLRWALKTLLRRHGLRAVSVEETRQ